jgi:acyl dehydratase
MTEVPFHALPAITQDQLRAYAVASGDPNPIHLDEAAARKAGLPGVIAHGMLSAAFVAERAENFAREALPGARWVSFQTRFKAMTLLGDVVTVGGKVKESAEGKLVLDLVARNQRGEVTTIASAVFRS